MSYNLKNKTPAPKADAGKYSLPTGEITGIELKNKSAAIIVRLTNSECFNYADNIFAYFTVSEKIVNTGSGCIFTG